MRNAAAIVDFALNPKPELVIHAGNLPATAEALRDLLAASGKLFDRGMPVRIIRVADGGPPSAMPLTKHNVVIEAHRLCQPVKIDRVGDLCVPKTLSALISRRNHLTSVDHVRTVLLCLGRFGLAIQVEEPT